MNLTSCSTCQEQIRACSNEAKLAPYSATWNAEQSMSKLQEGPRQFLVEHGAQMKHSLHAHVSARLCLVLLFTQCVLSSSTRHSDGFLNACLDRQDIPHRRGACSHWGNRLCSGLTCPASFGRVLIHWSCWGLPCSGMAVWHVCWCSQRKLIRHAANSECNRLGPCAADGLRWGVGGCVGPRCSR